MQYGLLVALDPHGGNLVNVRELLARSGVVRPRGRAGGDSSSSSSSGSERAVNPRAGRTAAQLEDYDLEDDFIDDAEVVDDDFVVQAGAPDADLLREAKRAKRGEEGRGGRKKKKKKKEGAAGMEPVFDGFYVSRGDIPMQAAGTREKEEKGKAKERKAYAGKNGAEGAGGKKKKENAKEKVVTKGVAGGAVAGVQRDGVDGRRVDGAVVTQRMEVEAKPSAFGGVETLVGKGGAAHPVSAPLVGAAPVQNVGSVSASVQGKPLGQVAAGPGDGGAGASPAAGGGGGGGGGGGVSGSGGGASAKKRKNSDVHAPAGTFKSLSPALRTMVAEMKARCDELFKERKPSINKSAELQELLHVLLTEARSTGVSKLVADKQTINVPDELWRELDFLRTTRANLEGLGWALYWSAEEDQRKDAVTAAEKGLSNAVEESRKRENEDVWDGEALAALHTWWDARCALLEASNELCDPAKTKSVKKMQSGWIDGLVKYVLRDFGVGEESVIGCIRAMEEAQAAQDRERKEAERLERLERKKAKQAQREAKRKSSVPGGGQSSAGGGGGGVLSRLESLKKLGSGGGGGGSGLQGVVPGPSGQASVGPPRQLPSGAIGASAAAAVKAAAAAAAASVTGGLGRLLPPAPVHPPENQVASGATNAGGKSWMPGTRLLPAVPPPPHPAPVTGAARTGEQRGGKGAEQTHETIVID